MFLFLLSAVRYLTRIISQKLASLADIPVIMLNNSSATESHPISLKPYIIYVSELPLLALHFAIAGFVTRQVHKRKSDYFQPFYKLFLLQCASNYLCYVMVRFEATGKDMGG